MAYFKPDGAPLHLGEKLTEFSDVCEPNRTDIY